MSVSFKYSSVGQGDNLVLLHGWGMNSGVWDALIPSLKDDYCVTTMDIPGFGENHALLPSTYNLESIAEIIAVHLPENTKLLGWSLGGLIAQKIALLYPQKLSQLVLVCSSPKFSKSSDWPGIEPSVLNMFVEQLKGDFAKTIERFLAIQAMGSDSARQDIKRIKQAIQQHPQPSIVALTQGLNILNDTDLRHQLKALTVPCHMLLGRLDTLVPATIVTLLADYTSNIQTHILDGAAHAPFISHTDNFAAKLKSILN